MEWRAGFSSFGCGRKRQPTDDLVEEQPLSKRLSLLNLNYANDANLRRNQNLKPSVRCPPMPPQEERMDVDNVIYISDLDSESDSENDDRLVFLPDIEKKLSKIPYSLAGKSGQSQISSSTSKELILYGVPPSLTVPEQKDNVRRAIIEARERLKQKQIEAPKSEEPMKVLQEPEVKVSKEEPSRVSAGLPSSIPGGVSNATLNGLSMQTPGGVPDRTMSGIPRGLGFGFASSDGLPTYGASGGGIPVPHAASNVTATGAPINWGSTTWPVSKGIIGENMYGAPSQGLDDWDAMEIE